MQLRGQQRTAQHTEDDTSREANRGNLGIGEHGLSVDLEEGPGYVRHMQCEWRHIPASVAHHVVELAKHNLTGLEVLSVHRALLVIQCTTAAG